MTGMVVRDWVLRGCWVSTIHPVYGELTRGLITSRPHHRDQQGRMTWSVSDQDHNMIYTLTGDYLDAEQILLAATTWADQPADIGDAE